MHLLPSLGVADMQSDRQNISRAIDEDAEQGQGRKEGKLTVF